MSDVLSFATREVVADYDVLRDECGLVDLPHLSLIAWRGDDRKGWLQGQVTNNLRTFDSGASSAFCFCENTGHIISVIEAWALPDAVYATVARSALAATLARTEQMTVMEDVAAVGLDKEYRLVSIQGPRATKRLSELIELPKLDAGTATLEGSDVLVFRSDRTGMGGWDLWLPARTRKPRKALEATLPTIASEAYEIARIEAGIPRFGSDMTTKTMPPEMGAIFTSRHVSYHKGCFTGQEVLMRIHSRGHTNRTWVGLVSNHPFRVGDLVVHGGREDIGTVTSAAASPDFGPIGAAMVRNQAAFEGESVRIKTEQGLISAEVRLMPLMRLE
jgi:folate-binding protein YgfZ